MRFPVNSVRLYLWFSDFQMCYKQIFPVFLAVRIGPGTCALTWTVALLTNKSVATTKEERRHSAFLVSCCIAFAALVVFGQFK